MKPIMDPEFEGYLDALANLAGAASVSRTWLCAKEINMTKTMIMRQGDVLLLQVKDRLHCGVAVAPTQDRLVLAWGEVTGHAHAVSAQDAQLYEDNAGQRYLRVIHPTRLMHEEHAEIPLAIGMYRVIQQREYTPQAFRTVAD